MLMYGCEMNTTRTAENLRLSQIIVEGKACGQCTYAAVAAKISVLEVVPCVREINRMAKTIAKPVMHNRRFRVPETCVRTAIAMTGIKQAMTVESADVNRSAVCSDMDSKVCCSSCSASDSGCTSFSFAFSTAQERIEGSGPLAASIASCCSCSLFR
jgi:hypothetical protein